MTASQFIVIMKYCGSSRPSSIDADRWMGMLLWYEARHEYKDWLEEELDW